MSSSSSVYTISLPVSEEYEDMINDVLRLLIVHLTVFVMYYMSSSSATFSSYVVLQLFMVLGIAMYWLVFKKLVRVEVGAKSSPRLNRTD